MDIFLSFVLGLAALLGFLPFFTGALADTWDTNTRDPWYTQLYFRWYPMVVGCLLFVGLMLICIFVLGADILNAITS